MNKLPEPFYRGKVRDLYDVDKDSMLICASDRISAFDVVFDEPFPGKGIVLSNVSGMWFQALRKSDLPARLGFTDQVITQDSSQYPPPFTNHPALDQRSVLVRKTKRIDFECVVRGYIVGSGWKDYQKSGGICGNALPAGLRLADRLPEPVFTPATKAALGQHDENVSIDRMQADIGTELAVRLRDISIAIYSWAAALLEPEGILLADTKFEFGLIGDEVVLIDEALTPDSSRYWDKSQYRPGISPDSFDKQIVRDYLETLDWDKAPPAPKLPAEIIERAMGRYRELQARVQRALGEFLD